MSKAYISVGIKNRKTLIAEIAAICATLEEFGITPHIFVDNYSFQASEEKTMMDTAFREIDDSDFLVAETSEKGIGVGIEIGYAKALGKRVIYLRNQSAEHSTTASGTSDFQVIYDSVENLNTELKEVIRQLISDPQ